MSKLLKSLITACPCGIKLEITLDADGKVKGLSWTITAKE